MRLYMHPVSNTSRPILLYVAENKLPVETEVVDLMTGAHHKEPYITLNPNRLVPTLVDGDFILTESSTILKYLADKFDLAAYPKDLKKRAKVNEMMDWFNTHFYHDYGYGVVYPQIYPHHKRPSDEVQKGTIAWAKELTKKWLQVLNDHWLSGNKKYLCGDQITIADYLGSAIMSIGELIHCDLKNYPNVQRWLGNVKKQPNYEKVNEVFNGFRASTQGKPWATV